MDFRGFTNLIGSFVLMVLLSQCCHIAYSQISPTFKGLECSCGDNCTYGVQECHLIRCACPYEADKYNPNVTCLDDLCPQNCCELIPRELRNHTATHFMFHENYESNNESEGVRTFQIFTKMDDSANARWLRTVLQQQPQLNFVYLAESISAQSMVEKLESGMTDILDNEAEAPDMIFGVRLDSMDDPKGFSVQLQCHDGIDTSCDSEFCSCLKFPKDNSIPVITHLKNITGGNIVYDIGNDNATVSTSSSLTPYRSIDVTKRPTDTLGGWAPFFNDSAPWVEFSDIQQDVCGVVVQGVDWALSRRLDKFEVEVDRRTVQSLEGKSYFVSGMISDSKNFHLFSTPEVQPNSLRIKVLQPVNNLNVGFRASLITCGDATNVLHEFCDGNSLAEDTKKEAEEVLREAGQKSGPLNGEDQVGLVVNIYDSLKTFLDENFEKYDFPDGSRFTVDGNNAEIDFYFVKLDHLKKTGYSFNNSETKKISDDKSGYASVYIPADGFSTDNDTQEVVVVTSVVGEDVHEEAEEKTSSDEYGYQYNIKSPVVTVNVFVKGIGHEAKQLIEKIQVKVPYNKNTSNPRPFYFEEANVSESKGMNIQWSTQKCQSTCKDSYCEIKCDHATSFAVLQLLGQSKLSKLGRFLSSILTTIGCGVSIISLVGALVMYFILRSSIASAHYAIHSNLMASLLIALCIFMMLLMKEKSKAMCEVIKFLLQYFFSAAFCWMLCEGIHLYRQIITVFDSGTKHLWVYFFIGWAVPLLFVVISITGTTIQRIESPLHTNDTCFFSYRDGSIWYFVAPVVVVMLINTGILVRVILVVVKAAKLQAEKDSEKAYQAKAGLRSALLLVPLLGCSYIIGFFVSFHGAFEFTYNIINSLQGFFIALLYCALNKEVRAAIGKYIERSRDQSTIQASTTGSTLPKSWPGAMAKHITSSRNQIAPEPIKKVRLEEVD